MKLIHKFSSELRDTIIVLLVYGSMSFLVGYYFRNEYLGEILSDLNGETLIIDSPSAAIVIYLLTGVSCAFIYVLFVGFLIIVRLFSTAFYKREILYVLTIFLVITSVFFVSSIVIKTFFYTVYKATLVGLLPEGDGPFYYIYDILLLQYFYLYLCIHILLFFFELVLGLLVIYMFKKSFESHFIFNIRIFFNTFLFFTVILFLPPEPYLHLSLLFIGGVIFELLVIVYVFYCRYRV